MNMLGFAKPWMSNSLGFSMKQTFLSLSLFFASFPQAFAHGGHFHLDEETLEKIFQFMDDVYHWFTGHLSVMFGIVVGMLVLLAIGKAVRARSS